MKKTIPFLRRAADAPSLPPELDLPLPDRVQVARDRVAHQDDPALLTVLSDREMAADRELAERERDHERRERTERIEAAAKAANRVRRTIDDLAEQQAADLIRAEKAIAQQRHASSPHAKVALLHRRKELMLRIVTSVLVGALAVSAVSVQHNIAPTGGPTNIWWWMAYGIEFLISGILIALVMSAGDTAEWGVIEKPWKAHAIEGVLLAVTIALNTFPFFKNREYFQIGVHAIAPIVIGAALLAHRVIAARYSQSIERATAALVGTNHDDLQTRLAALTRITAAHREVPAIAVAPAARASVLPAGAERAGAEALGPEGVQASFAPEDSYAHPQAPVDAHPHVHLESAHAQGVRIGGAHAHQGVRMDAHLEPIGDARLIEGSADPQHSSPDAHPHVHLESAHAHAHAEGAHPADAHPAHDAHPGDAHPAHPATASETAGLAAEIARQQVSAKSVEDIERILALDKTGIAPSTIARETGIHYRTVTKILDTAKELQRPQMAAGGGRVIELDRRTKR